MVTMSANINPGGATVGYWLSVAVTGATTLAASDTNSCVALAASSGSVPMTSSATLLVSGLTAGTNTFTLNGKSNFNNATTVSRRQIIVCGIA
jgi:hypothetical protein